MSATDVHALADIFTPPPAPQPPPVDVEAYAYESALRSLIFLGANSSPRSTQDSLGSSEAGSPCDRQLAYRLSHVPAVNLRDPLASLFGIGFHAAMAELFRRLDAGAGRFLVEQAVTYRGVPGTTDLFDRMSGTVVDWKSTKKAKIAAMRRDGPSQTYVVQVQLYGAALAARGEMVRYVALCFVPIDDDLDEMWLWRAPFNPQVADEAIERLERLRGLAPDAVAPTPSRLCPWCNHHRPQSTDIARACPGVAEGSNS